MSRVAQIDWRMLEWRARRHHRSKNSRERSHLKLSSRAGCSRGWKSRSRDSALFLCRREVERKSGIREGGRVRGRGSGISAVTSLMSFLGNFYRSIGCSFFHHGKLDVILFSREFFESLLNCRLRLSRPIYWISPFLTLGVRFIWLFCNRERSFLSMSNAFDRFLNYWQNEDRKRRYFWVEVLTSSFLMDHFESRIKFKINAPQSYEIELLEFVLCCTRCCTYSRILGL